LAFDPQTRQLFAGCRGGQLMVVLDANTGKAITTDPIGERVDAAACDPRQNWCFSQLGGGTIAVFHEDSADKYAYLENIVTNPGSRPWDLIPKRIGSSCPRISEATLLFLF